MSVEWIETKVIRRAWPWQWEGYGDTDGGHKGTILYDTEEFPGFLNEIVTELEADGGWEIRGVFPLQASRVYSEGLTNREGGARLWGAAFGYAAAYSRGIVVFVQRTLQFASADERDAYRARVQKERVAEERARLADLRNQVPDVVRNKKLLGTDWHWNGNVYGSEAEAIQAREQRLRYIDALLEKTGAGLQPIANAATTPSTSRSGAPSAAQGVAELRPKYAEQTWCERVNGRMVWRVEGDSGVYSTELDALLAAQRRASTSG